MTTKKAKSPYQKYNKKPYHYPWERRTANGQVRPTANQSPSNKYRMD